MARLAGAAIAAAEARAFFPDTRRQLALDEKESDLLKSIALLQEQDVHIQRLEGDFAALAQRVRDAVLHALPAWVAAATSAASSPLHDTDRFTLLDQLQAVVLTLKTPH
jgi:hypothetical protein